MVSWWHLDFNLWIYHMNLSLEQFEESADVITFACNYVGLDESYLTAWIFNNFKIDRFS